MIACPGSSVASVFTNSLLLLTIIFRLWYDWVVTTLGPWVAAKDSGESHPAPSEYAKATDRLVGVLGAGWMKTTESLGHNIPEQTMIKGQGALVKADERQNHLFQHGMEHTPSAIALSTT